MWSVLLVLVLVLLLLLVVVVVVFTRRSTASCFLGVVCAMVLVLC